MTQNLKEKIGPDLFKLFEAARKTEEPLALLVYAALTLITEERTALLKQVKGVVDNGIVKEFIEATPIWYDELHDEKKRAPQCLMCGIKPDNMLRLATALKFLLQELDTLKEN